MRRGRLADSTAVTQSVCQMLGFADSCRGIGVDEARRQAVDAFVSGYLFLIMKGADSLG